MVHSRNGSRLHRNQAGAENNEQWCSCKTSALQVKEDIGLRLPSPQVGAPLPIHCTVGLQCSTQSLTLNSVACLKASLLIRFFPPFSLSPFPVPWVTFLDAAICGSASSPGSSERVRAESVGRQTVGALHSQLKITLPVQRYCISFQIIMHAFAF